MFSKFIEELSGGTNKIKIQILYLLILNWYSDRAQQFNKLIALRVHCIQIATQIKVIQGRKRFKKAAGEKDDNDIVQ